MIVSALQDAPRLSRGEFPDHQRAKRRKVAVPSAATGRVPQSASGQGHGHVANGTGESAFEDDDEISNSVPAHPLGIKPLGNSWDAKVNIKAMSGCFARLPDELLLQLLEVLDAPELTALGATCKALYAFCRSDDLWKSLFIESPKTSSDFVWRGTWRSTFLNLAPHATSAVQCSGLFSDQLYRPFHCANLPLTPYTSNIPARNAIARLPDLTAEEYMSRWADKPFILTEPVKSWPVYKEWSIEHLLEAHGDTVFRAEAVDWKFKTYVDYMRNSNDESPLYLFDCHFAEKMGLNLPSTTNNNNTTPSAPGPAATPRTNPNNKNTSQHTPPPQAYTPPPAFTPDLFDHLAPHRPHHRWLILGPRLSGSTFHADPNGTSAWNAVLRGAKYWLLFPPSALPIPGVHLSPDLAHITAPLSLPEYLLGFHAAARAAPGAVEAVCTPGELLHVPAGWFHMVVNVDEGVALTQNFVAAPGLAGALGFLRSRRDQVSGFAWGRGAAAEVREAGGDGEEDSDGEAYGEGREFELFVSRLRKARPELLERALQELEVRDREAAAAGKRRRLGTRWEQATRSAGSGAENGDAGQGFSFGFGDDGSDVDDEEQDNELQDGHKD